MMNGLEKRCSALIGFALYPLACTVCFGHSFDNEPNWRAQITGLNIKPVGMKSNISSIGGEVVTPSQRYLGMSLSYFITPNWAIEFQGGPFQRSYKIANSRVGTFPVAKISNLAVGISIQYHFSSVESLSPYVGVGLNHAWTKKVKGAPGIPDFDVKDITSKTFVAGVDYRLSARWILTTSIQYILTPEYGFSAPGFETSVKINTLITGIGLGYRF